MSSANWTRHDPLALLPLAVAGCLIDACAFAYTHQWLMASIYLALAIIPVARKRWADRQARRIPAYRIKRRAA